jgi:hypothetical protein
MADFKNFTAFLVKMTVFSCNEKEVRKLLGE